MLTTKSIALECCAWFSISDYLDLVCFCCYRHCSSLFLQNGNGVASLMHSREGLTQGNPISMVDFSVGVLLLTKQLKVVYPDFTQPWYAQNAGSLIKLYFNYLKQSIPSRWYYPEFSKSGIIVHPDNIATRKQFALRHRFKVCNGDYYLCGFIADN